jgi:hypothetical protein
MTVFTVPLKGTTVTIKAGAFNGRGRVTKRAIKVRVDRVSVAPDRMFIVGSGPNGDYVYRRITEPSMIVFD